MYNPFKRHYPLFVLISITILGFVPRILYLDALAFNFDEAIYFLRSRPFINGSVDFNQLTSRGDVKFPLYSFLIYLTSSIITNIDLSARLTSAIVSTLIIPATYLLLRKRCGNYALIAALLIAVNPLLIQYGRIAIADNCMFFITIISIWSFLKVVDKPEYRYSVILGISCAILVLFKLTAFITLSTFVIALPFMIYPRKDSARRVRDVLFAYLPKFSIVFLSFISTVLAVQILLTGDALFIVKTATYTSPRMGVVYMLSRYFDFPTWIYDQFFFLHNMNILSIISVVAFFIFILEAKRTSFANLERILIIFTLVMLFSIAYAKSSDADAYFVRYILPLLIVPAYLVTQFSRRCISRKKYSSYILVGVITAIVAQSSLAIPQVVNNNEYDDYWHIQDFREAGTFLNNRTTKNDLLFANTHISVLEAYSERTAFAYFGTDGDYIIVYNPYIYGIVNPRIYIEKSIFVSLFKYLVVTDRYIDRPGVALQHTYIAFSRDFNDLIKEHYSPVKKLKNSVIYQRNSPEDTVIDSKIIDNREPFYGKIAKYTVKILGKNMTFIVESLKFDNNVALVKICFDAETRGYGDYIVDYVSTYFLVQSGTHYRTWSPVIFREIYAGPTENKIFVLPEKNMTELSFIVGSIIIYHEGEIETIYNLVFKDLLTSPKIVKLEEYLTNFKSDLEIFKSDDVKDIKIDTTNGASGQASLFKNGSDSLCKISYDISSSTAWSSLWLYKEISPSMNLTEFNYIKLTVYGDGKGEILGVDFIDINGNVTRCYSQISWIGWKDIFYDLNGAKTAPYGKFADMSKITAITLLINDNGGGADVQGIIYIKSIKLAVVALTS